MTELIPTKKPSPWEDERVVLWLRKLWPDNSARIIAGKLSEEFGVKITRNAVIGKLHRLGLTQENSGKRPPVVRGPRALRRPRAPRPANRPILKIINSSWGHQRIVETTTAGLPALICAEITPLNLTMDQLGLTTCRYPYGDSEVTYCGHGVFDRSFCAVHYRLAYMPPKPRRAVA